MGTIPYTVHKSFWAHNDNAVNWDVKEHGREGIGIPERLLIRAKNERKLLRVTVEDRGSIYQVYPVKVLDHEKAWNTKKTAPKGARNLFIITPTSMHDFYSFTPEKQAEIDLRNAEEAEKKRIAEAQQSLF